MQFLEAQASIQRCRQTTIKEDDKSSCKHCAQVYECEKIGEYLALAFAHHLGELRACQARRGVAGCSACAEFFECGVRRAYVDATYEKLNKSRGGEFDF